MNFWWLRKEDMWAWRASLIAHVAQVALCGTYSYLGSLAGATSAGV